MKRESMNANTKMNQMYELSGKDFWKISHHKNASTGIWRELMLLKQIKN